ncbi:MAG: lysophospholipid acyltransferase family protein [Alphaproteobacteria bacterium]
MTLARSLVFFLLSLVWTIVLAVVAAPTLLSRGAVRWVSHLWARVVLWLLRIMCGLGADVRGREHVLDTPAIYAFKHQSAWETVILPLLVPRLISVLKRELLYVPFYGWYVARLGMVPIDRSRGTSALRLMLREARRKLDEGCSIMIAPEGTRTAPGKSVKYLPGVAAMYERCAVPVVPVAVNSGLFWPRRSWLKHPGRVTLEFLPAIPAGMPRNEFMALLHARLEDASLRLLAEGRATYFRTPPKP